MNSEHNGEPGTQPSAHVEVRHDVDENGKVDRIRDILFGPQMRDYDSRFQRLDERLTREATESRGEMQRRLEALENHFKGEFESMNNRLNTDRTERENALEIARNLGAMVNVLQQKVNGIGEHTDREFHHLREQLLEQAKNLSADINAKHDQLRAGLDRETAQIRGAMTVRDTLSEMLSDVALRLKSNGSRMHEAQAN